MAKKAFQLHVKEGIVGAFKRLTGTVSGTKTALDTSIITALPSGNNIIGSLDDYLLKISKGEVSGSVGLHKFGKGIVAGANREALWDGANLSGITGYTYMSSGSTLYISSDDAGDTQVYKVIGNDATGALQTKNVTASGKTFVAIDGTWDAVWRVENQGTTDNAGNIYISDDNTDAGGNGIPDTLTAVKAMILAGFNQTLMAIYRVPLEKTLYIYDWYTSMGKGDDSEVTFWIRENGGVFKIKDHQDAYQNNLIRYFYPPLKIDALSDIEVRGEIGAAGGEISAGFNGVLVND